MKKAICVMLAAMLLVLGTACEKQPETEVPFPAQETTQALLESGAFSEQLEQLDLDIAVMLFWLGGDVSEYDGSSVYYSSGATSEIAAVIRVQDEAKVPEVEQALKNWVESQIEAERDYRPAEVPKLEKAIIESRAASVLLVVAADADKAVDAVETVVSVK